MPKNKVSDLITDQEMAFARQVLSGGMTDRQAAETVGLNPDSAAYIKSKPTVRAYMLEHRAAVQQHVVQQEADGLRRLNLDRERVLDRLWEIAHLSPEMTRGSITGQVKALSMIIAMQNLIPDRRVVDRLGVSSEKTSTPAPIPQTHTAAWLARHKPKTIDPQPSPTGSVGKQPPSLGPNQSTLAHPFTPSEAPRFDVPIFASVPDLGVPFPIKNPFVNHR
jgi:hypothetical protein